MAFGLLRILRCNWEGFVFNFDYCSGKQVLRSTQFLGKHGVFVAVFPALMLDMHLLGHRRLFCVNSGTWRMHGGENWAVTGIQAWLMRYEKMGIELLCSTGSIKLHKMPT